MTRTAIEQGDNLFVIVVGNTLHVVEANGDEFNVLSIAGEPSYEVNPENRHSQTVVFVDEILGVLGEDSFEEWRITLITYNTPCDLLTILADKFLSLQPRGLEIRDWEILLPDILMKMGMLSLGQEITVGFGSLAWHVAIDETGKVTPPQVSSDAPEVVLQVMDVPHAFLADFSFTSDNREMEKQAAELAGLTKEFSQLKDDHNELDAERKKVCADLAELEKAKRSDEERRLLLLLQKQKRVKNRFYFSTFKGEGSRTLHSLPSIMGDRSNVVKMHGECVKKGDTLIVNKSVYDDMNRAIQSVAQSAFQGVYGTTDTTPIYDGDKPTLKSPVSGKLYIVRDDHQGIIGVIADPIDEPCEVFKWFIARADNIRITDETFGLAAKAFLGK